MVNQTQIHGKLVSRVQYLMYNYPDLEPETQQEILRFLKTPEMLINLKLKTKKKRNFLKEALKTFGGKLYFVV
jgi:hypothetical protein